MLVFFCYADETKRACSQLILKKFKLAKFEKEIFMKIEEGFANYRKFSACYRTEKLVSCLF